jgi:DNA-binding ferritin-like protein
LRAKPAPRAEKFARRLKGSRVTTSLIDDAEYWRKRAEEARALAEQMKDTHTKSLMLGIAESYEKIAKWAAERTDEPR